MELGIDKIVWFNGIWLRFENYPEWWNTQVCMISNFKLHIIQLKLSFLRNYLIWIKIWSFAIFNSSVLATVMSDSPTLIPQSFFLLTVCTLMIADVNTSYGS